LHTEIQELKK